MSRAEIPNPNLSLILHFFLITLTPFAINPLVSNRYSGMITIKINFTGLLCSDFDVILIAWAREVKHWTSTEKKCNIKVRISLKPFSIQP